MHTKRNKNGHKKRLREKYNKAGLDSLHDYEILELFLGFVDVRKDKKPLAKKLINEFGNISSVLDASTNKLQKFKGIGPRTASFIKYVKDIITYYLKEQSVKNSYVIDSPESVVNHFIAYYGSHRYEEFCIIFLDGQNNIIDIQNYQKGTVNYSQVYPRNILKDALKLDAVSLVMVHNHPSGNLNPSEADIAFTKKMMKSAKLIDIDVLDHLIIAEKNHKSLKQEGLV